MVEKRILILTSDAGYGHRSAAYALESALEELYGEKCISMVANPADREDSPDLIRDLEDGYDEMVVQSPMVYQLSYHTLDAPLVSDAVRAVVSQLFHESMCSLFEKFQPHAVISTYPFHAKAVARVAKELEIDCPMAVVITDLTDVQSLWYSSEATMHYVPTPAIREQAYQNHIPATRVRVTGIPVDPGFARETRSSIQLRKSLGWSEKPPTCLIVASPRIQEMARISTLLDQMPELQVAVVCGGNAQLFGKLDEYNPSNNFHLYDWADNMPQLMKAADFIISKAGGLIVSESLACGRPMILTEALPGQETGNMHYVVENQAGAWAPGPVEVLLTAITWLKNERALLKKAQSHADRLGKPEAAYDIARSLWGLTQV